MNAPPFGLTWLRERLSAPASKWHVAHAVRPSLPACMSQKSALPSLTALGRSRTKSPSFGGDGTGSVLSGAGSPGPSALAWVPPASRRTSADAATMPDANSPAAHGTWQDVTPVTGRPPTSRHPGTDIGARRAPSNNAANHHANFPGPPDERSSGRMDGGAASAVTRGPRPATIRGRVFFSRDNFVLTIAQAACIVLPAAGVPVRLQRFRTGAWALVLPLNIAVVVLAIALIPTTADVLTWVALLLVPLGCALALGLGGARRAAVARAAGGAAARARVGRARTRAPARPRRRC